MTYAMIASDVAVSELTRNKTFRTFRTYRKFLFFNNSLVYLVCFAILGLLVLLKNVKSTCGRMLHLIKFQAVSLRL